MAPKLTYSHIYPRQLEKMRVYLVTQIFSNSVAARMSTASISKILPPSAQFMIVFISDVDKLFNIFNSSKIPNRKNYNCPLKLTTLKITH
jgi:hypothetical protein